MYHVGPGLMWYICHNVGPTWYVCHNVPCRSKTDVVRRITSVLDRQGTRLIFLVKRIHINQLVDVVSLSRHSRSDVKNLNSCSASVSTFAIKHFSFLKGQRFGCG